MRRLLAEWSPQFLPPRWLLQKFKRRIFAAHSFEVENNFNKIKVLQRENCYRENLWYRSIDGLFLFYTYEKTMMKHSTACIMFLLSWDILQTFTITNAHLMHKSFFCGTKVLFKKIAIYALLQLFIRVCQS